MKECIILKMGNCPCSGIPLGNILFRSREEYEKYIKENNISNPDFELYNTMSLNI